MALSSLSWPIFNDLASMGWFAQIANQYQVLPYRDYWDLNFPGTHVLYQLIGQLFGFSEKGFHRADLLILVISVFGIGSFLRKWSWQSAWMGCVAFALVYLGYGSKVTLEREFFILVFLVWSLVALFRWQFNSAIRYFFTGVFFGLIATIKPHALIGIPIILWIDWIYPHRNYSNHTRLKHLLYLFLGGSCVVGIALIGLYQQGLLHGFIDGFNFLSSYRNTFYSCLPAASGVSHGVNLLFSFTGIPLNSQEFLQHSLIVLWLPIMLIIPALIGIRAKPPKDEHLEARMLMSLIAAYWGYVLIANRFYYYHYLPMMLMLVLLGAWALSDKLPYFQRHSIFFQCLVGGWFSFLVITPPFGIVTASQTRYSLSTISITEQVKQMTVYLREHAHPGDSIQGLLGPNHAVHYVALLTNLRPATQFLLTIHVTDGPRDRKIKNQQQFIAEWHAHPPRFVVTYISDPLTQIPGVKLMMKSDYRQVLVCPFRYGNGTTNRDLVLWEAKP